MFLLLECSIAFQLLVGQNSILLPLHVPDFRVTIFETSVFETGRTRNMYKLVALDLDGTLLNSKKEIPSKTMEYLQKLSLKGTQIVPATGRFPAGFPKQLRESKFIHYAICLNGSLVLDLYTNSAIYYAPVAIDTAEMLYDFCKSEKLYIDVLTGSSAFVDKESFSMVHTIPGVEPYLKMFLETRKIVDNLSVYLKQNHIDPMKIQILTDNQNKKKQLIAELEGKFPQLNVTSSIPPNIEITSKKANKAIGLEVLSQYLNIKPEEIIAFGDEDNDCQMLNFAEVGVAMGNSNDRIKKEADYVTSSCDEEGVLSALQHFFISNPEKTEVPQY